MNKNFVIFDFDGTIADTPKIALKVVNDFARDAGRPPVTQEEFNRLRNHSLFEIRKEHDISWFQMIKILLQIRPKFREYMPEVPLIDGMKELLHDLYEDPDVRVGVLTSNTVKNVQMFFERHNIGQVDFILSPTFLFSNKVRELNKLIRREKLDPKQMVQIGDEARDVIAANRVNMDAIAVTWGFHTAEHLEKFKPAHIVTSPQDLRSLVYKLIGKA